MFEEHTTKSLKVVSLGVEFAVCDFYFVFVFI